MRLPPPWGEIAVVILGNQLAHFYMPTSDPLAGLARFKKTGEHRFRRVRDDGKLREELVFEFENDALADTPHSHHSPTDGRRRCRLDGAQHKRAEYGDRRACLADDSGLEPFKVDGDVGELWHDLVASGAFPAIRRPTLPYDNP